MPDLLLYEDLGWEDLVPLTWTRPVWELRYGILTLREKVERRFPDHHFLRVPRPALRDLFGALDRRSDEVLLFNGRGVMTDELAQRLRELPSGVRLVTPEGETLAARVKGAAADRLWDRLQQQAPIPEIWEELPAETVEAEMVRYLWEMVHGNPAQILADYRLLTERREALGYVSRRADVIGSDVFLEDGATVDPGVIVDTREGPVYLGAGARIMPNAVLIGPVAVGEKSLIKVGAKIYEGTTLGPVCKVGGEVEESIFQGYSNKQHDGFLGHAYIGEWVNLGADTNNSDLKNTYGSVKVWLKGRLVDTGQMFVGLFMGDHSKSGINTMFNTGTHVGVAVNVFGGDFPPKFLPSFVWGGAGHGWSEHRFEKAVETARRVMARRKVELTPAYERLLRWVFEQTRKERADFLETGGRRAG